MNWSAYSKYVGDIFGAPLAMEGLAAFFLESTFLGLWIFGWDRLKPKVHLATIWIVAIGTTMSAYFILAANSWMQHPVGYKINPVTHRAEMTSIAQILTNSTLIRAFGHTIAAAGLTGSMLVLGVAAWHLRRSSEHRPLRSRRADRALDEPRRRDRDAAARPHPGAADDEAAADEDGRRRGALPDEDRRAVLAVRPRARGRRGRTKSLVSIAVPHGLSILADNSWNGKVLGINDIEAAYVAKYGPGDYRPIVGVDLLELPDHDRARLPRAPDRRVRALARARARPDRTLEGATCASPSGRSRCR